jgi:hypothetical protein
VGEAEAVADDDIRAAVNDLDRARETLARDLALVDQRLKAEETSLHKTNNLVMVLQGADLDIRGDVKTVEALLLRVESIVAEERRERLEQHDRAVREHAAIRERADGIDARVTRVREEQETKVLAATALVETRANSLRTEAEARARALLDDVDARFRERAGGGRQWVAILVSLLALLATLGINLVKAIP